MQAFSFYNMDQVRQTCLFYSHTKPNKTTLLVVYIKPIGNDESMQILVQMHWGLLYALNQIAVPPTYLQEDFYLHSLLQSQKSG